MISKKVVGNGVWHTDNTGNYVKEVAKEEGPYVYVDVSRRKKQIETKLKFSTEEEIKM